MKKLSIALLFFIPSLVFGASTLWEFYQPSMPSLSERAVIYANYFSDTYTGTAEQNTKLLTVLDSKEAPMILGASVLYPYQGGTGKGSVVVGDVGKYLKVSDDSPFTYSFDTPAGGAGDITGASSLGTGTNLFDTESAGVLRFNTISAGTNVTFSTSSNANTIVINSSGGGASFGQAWEINGLGKLAPTTTVAIAVGATGTSTFSGGIESGTKISAPYFNATSTTATSTFAGGLTAGNNAAFVINKAATANSLVVAANGNVGIGTTNPGAKFTVGSNLTVNTNPDVTISGHFVAGGSTGGVMVGYTGNTIQGRTGTGSVLNTNGNLNLNPYGGNVGIGTTTPQRKLEIYDGASGGVGNSNAELVLEDNGNAGLSILGTTVHSGSIYFGDSTNNALGVIQYGLSSHATNANALMFQTNASEKMRITSNGNVGIGTTSPISILTITKSDATAYNPTTLAGTGDTLTLINSSATDNNSSEIMFKGTSNLGTDLRSAAIGAVHTSHTSGSSGGDLFFSTTGGGTFSEKMRILGTGNVGIGTTSPGAKLHVEKSDADLNSGFLRLYNSLASAGMSYGMDYAFSNTNSASTVGAGMYSYITSRSAGTENVDLALFTLNDGSYTEKVRIKDTGNVGIGTTSPAKSLDVYVGAYDLEGIRVTRLGHTMGFGIDSNGNYVGGNIWVEGVRFANFENGGLALGAGYIANDVPSNGLIIQGNVGIGTTSPAAKLSVNQGSTGLGMYLAGYSNNTSDLFRISTSTLLATSTAFSINSNGKVGIGTTTPSQQLSVAGNAYVSGVVVTAKDRSMVLASSTLAYMGAFGASGTTTILISNPTNSNTLMKFYCKTDTGTAWVGFGSGTATTSEANCSTTGVEVTPTTNNTWASRANMFVEVGRSANTPNTITITANIRENAQ